MKESGDSCVGGDIVYFPSIFGAYVMSVRHILLYAFYIGYANVIFDKNCVFGRVYLTHTVHTEEGGKHASESTAGGKHTADVGALPLGNRRLGFTPSSIHPVKQLESEN